MRGGYADLHLHTRTSDGTDSVARMVLRARAAGLSTVAITDHDAISSELSERVAETHGVEVIAGVELKADFDGVAGELLGYFIDPQSEDLRRHFAWMEEARRSRMEEMVAKCRDAGLGVDLPDVRRHAAGNFGRPHLARALVDAQAVGSVEEAFAKLIGRGRPCYAPVEKPSLREAIDVLREAGAAISIAHPCLMRVADWDGFLDMLVGEGVDALELMYPYHASPRRELTISPQLLAAKAARRGLLSTGGSDDHGVASGKATLGQVRLPYDRVAALRAVCGM